MATNDTSSNDRPMLRTRTRDNMPYEIPLDDSPPESFVEAAKTLIDGRGVEKLWDRFIEELTESTVWGGPLHDELDEDTRELGEAWVIEATLRRFGFQFMGVPMEYRAGMTVPGTVSVQQVPEYDAVANDQEG